MMNDTQTIPNTTGGETYPLFQIVHRRHLGSVHFHLVTFTKGTGGKKRTRVKTEIDTTPLLRHTYGGHGVELVGDKERDKKPES